MDASSLNDDTKLELFRALNLFEKHRIESFHEWPFPSTSSCSIGKMAEAGFYWTGTKRENDTATCFVCGKTLDGWESEDDPWKEHLKHAPQCEFVKMGCAEKNLSLSQFLKIYGTVVNGHVEKNIKKFKSKFEKDYESKLDGFLRQG